ncbi:MAG: hypothetical protein ACW97V_19815, partial [Promethearchaeota archaeon]
RISYEHDKLLEELEIWQKFEISQATLPERIRFSGMTEALKILGGKKAIESPELETELPVMLVFMSKTGYMLFSNPFTTDISFDENRIGEFVSFFNSFIDQMFSVSIDRVRFGDFTILHKVLDSISICYLFEGQSYIALKRLTSFYEAIKEDSSIMDNLSIAKKTGEKINLKEIPKLEALVAENFLSDPQEIGVSTEPDDAHKLIKKSRRIRKQVASKKKKISKIIIAEIEIEVVAVLLFITSHLLFLAILIGKVNFPIGGAVGGRVIVDLTLYLGIGCLIIVINIMIFNWLKDILKNKFVTAEIIIQILALLLILTAHIFYLDYVGQPKHIQILKGGVYTIIIDSALIPGIGCMLTVILLILIDYMQRR